MSSTGGQELKLKMNSNIPRAFQWVMASSASSAMTIGERNKKINMWRGDQWIPLVIMPALFIAGTAGAANIVYTSSSSEFPWWLPVIMLAGGVYPAVIFLAMGHLTLFLPEAPFAAREALFNVGYKGIGFGLVFTSGFALFFGDQPWVQIALACIVGALIAAVVAFWVCLVRTYGKDLASIKRGLATSLALSSIFTAAFLAFFISFPRFLDAQRMARDLQ